MTSPPERITTTMRIKLKYPNVRTFVERYAQHISPGGIFITTRAPKPVGTRLRFEFLLDHPTEPTSLLRGEGLVQWTREFDPQVPAKSHGMGVKFTQLDERSAELVAEMLAFRNQNEVDVNPPRAPEPQTKPEERPKRPTLMGAAPRFIQPAVKVPPEVFSVEDVLQLVDVSPPPAKPSFPPPTQPPRIPSIAPPQSIAKMPRLAPTPPKAVAVSVERDPIERLCQETGIDQKRLEQTTERFRLRRGDAMRQLEELLRRSKA